MSLDRLIDLAKKTGDRLIVHNPLDGSNLVIMDICDYEVLVDADYGHRDIRAMSSEQLINQINRDIAIWRADKDVNGEWEEDEDCVDDSSWECEDDFFVSGDSSSEPWHGTAEILEDRFGPYFEKNSDEKNDNDLYDNDFVTGGHDIEDVFNVASFEPIEEGNEKVNQPKVDFESNVEPQFNYVPTRHPLDMPVSSLEWEEDRSGDDEPVFLEEPVSF